MKCKENIKMQNGFFLSLSFFIIDIKISNMNLLIIVFKSRKNCKCEEHGLEEKKEEKFISLNFESRLKKRT